MTQRQSLEDRFWKFHGAHPEVYEHLQSNANFWLTRFGDGSKLGIKQLYERVRWEISLNTGETPKLNNNFTAFYARLLMDREPRLAGMFKLRQQRRQATIGPSNQGLDPGGQII